MEDLDQIIVFAEFNSSIEANIVKGKLDAYDVACFLSEENMANLYPGNPILSFRVKLHLFEKDKERAQQILEDQTYLSVDNEATVKCLRCQSPRIERDFPREYDQKFSWSLSVLFFGVFFPEKKIYRCKDCEFEFKKT
jgi:hypothetical protein